MVNESVNEGTKTSETASNLFEVEICGNIKSFLQKVNDKRYNNLSVAHYEESDSKYHSDISITNLENNKQVWIEVKKDKYANLGSSSWKYQDGEWSCTTLEDNDPLLPVLKNALEKEGASFIEHCKSFLKTDDIKLPTDLSPELINAWKNKGSVSDTDNDVQFITNKVEINDFGSKIAEYYKSSKEEQVFYIQVGDELYIIDPKSNPLGLKCKDGSALRPLSDVYKLGRIQFRAKGLEKKLKDETKYYYNIYCDVKILADKDAENVEYNCSFKTPSNYPVVDGVDMINESEIMNIKESMRINPRVKQYSYPENKPCWTCEYCTERERRIHGNTWCKFDRCVKGLVKDMNTNEAEHDIGGDKSEIIPQSGVKIWIDDIREVPPGFKWIKTVNDFIKFIEENGTQNISLIDTDHDAGDYQRDGGDYINCFDYLRMIGAKNMTIHIHSANPVGANHIRQIISRMKDDGWREVRNTSK